MEIAISNKSTTSSSSSNAATESSSSSSHHVVLDSCLLLFATVALSLSIFLTDADSACALVTTSPRKLQGDELDAVRLFQKNTPCVVYITYLAVKCSRGRCLDSCGIKMIRGASDLRVTLSDQVTYNAKVVGFDQDKDVAVLHVDAPKEKLRPIPVGISSDLLVGQKVYAIGNPFGLDHTLTNGVIRR